MVYNYPVVSAFSNFESSRNARSGVFAGSLGNVTFKESTFSENLRAGFEFEKILIKNVIQVESVKITAREDNNTMNNSNPVGIIPPGSEDFQIS